MGVFLLITLLAFLSNTAGGGRYQDCPEGWTKGDSKCFKLVKRRFVRSDALWKCKHHFSASLAVIGNIAENKVVADLLGKLSSAWIGLRRRHKYEQFKWDDEKEVQYSYTNWENRRRRNYGDCVRILSTGGWQRAVCSQNSHSVCFRNAGCLPGWTGEECDRPCHCYRGFACNGTDPCPYGCELGWVGERCDTHIDKPEVSFYCMKDREGYSLKLTLDQKSFSFSNFGAVNAEGEISYKCDKQTFFSRGSRVQIRNVSGVWKSDCPIETVGTGILKWTFRHQKRSGVVSYEDDEVELLCDLSQADTIYDDSGRVRMEEIRERTVTSATQTRVSHRTYLADPDTLVPVTNVSLGVPVRLVVKLPEEDGVVNPFFNPRNCQAASPDGNVTVKLTDDSGCFLRGDIGFGTMKSVSRVIQSKPFPMFYLPGYTEVVFTCSLVPSSRFRNIPVIEQREV